MCVLCSTPGRNRNEPQCGFVWLNQTKHDKLSASPDALRSICKYFVRCVGFAPTFKGWKPKRILLTQQRIFKFYKEQLYFISFHGNLKPLSHSEAIGHVNFNLLFQPFIFCKFSKFLDCSIYFLNYFYIIYSNLADSVIWSITKGFLARRSFIIKNINI